jgi:hypothetical protein
MTPVRSLKTGLISGSMLVGNPAYVPDRAVFMGGNTSQANSYATNTIDYIASIATLSNAIDFGDLSAARSAGDGCSSESRGLYGGGANTGGTTQQNIDYITLATTGNGTNFGNLTQSRDRLGSLSNNTRGLWAGGYTGSAEVNTIDYVTIATTGNGTDFGDLYQTVFAEGCGAANTTRGIFSGGAYNGGGNYYNGNQYVTIATAGNASYFGALENNKTYVSGGASATRYISSAGIYTNGTATNVLEYVTIATTGNAADFGDLTVSRASVSCTTNGTRMLNAGGLNPSDWSNYNTIDYVTIASTGNAIDFGDLTQGRGYKSAGTSTCHGGI